MLKKIETKEAKRKKEKRKNLILAIAMIVILMGSVFGIVLSNFGTETPVTSVGAYKGFNLTDSGSYYLLEVQNIRFSFLEDPRNLNSLEAEVELSKTLNEYVQGELFLYSTDQTSADEIKRNFGLFSKNITGLCSGGICDESKIDCSKNTVVIKESQTNSIYEKEGCTYVEGKKGDLLALTDEFILQTIGLGNK